MFSCFLQLIQHSACFIYICIKIYIFYVLYKKRSQNALAPRSQRPWTVGPFGHRLAYDALGSSDILFITEMHESHVRPLLDITGYHQYLACRQETRSLGGVRGLGGVACFVRDSRRSRISLVATDKFAQFMWVRVCGVSLLARDIFIFVCYFPPTSSSFAIHNGPNGDPFIELYADIT
jgi:hypothetical protein